MRLKRAMAVAAAVVVGVPIMLGLSTGATDWSVAGDRVDRVAGADRYHTAVEVAALAGGGSLAGLDRLIVVSGESFPDGLAASGLAGFLDDGGRSGRTAILLTRTDVLPAVVDEAIRTSGVPADQILVVGGVAAVSDAVRAAIATAAGWDGTGVVPVIRIAGQDRYGTAAAIVDYVVEAAGDALPASYRTVLVASGEQFPDALAAGTLAYRNGHLLVLSRQAAAPAVTLDAVRGLSAECAVLVGGIAALAPLVATQIDTALVAGQGCGVERIAGRDRYDTAAQVANRFVAVNGPPRQPILASGADFADALTTGPLAAGNRPLLLTTPNELPAATTTWLQQERANTDDVLIIGGTNTISPSVEIQVDQILDPPPPPTPPGPGPSPTTVPSAPTITVITPGDGELSVAFTPGADGGSEITNYEYSTDDGASWTARDPADTTSPLTITDLVNGTTYQVQIRAVNAVGEGAASNMVSGRPAGETCATYGVCEVGDTGPGGGIVFYVHPGDGTFPCGPSLDLTCRYLEAWTDDATTAADPPAAGMAWSGITDTLVPDPPGSRLTAIGTGYQNTVAAVSQSAVADRAITVARQERGGKSDWYLPSEDELNELCKYARQQETGNVAVLCTTANTLRPGFALASYWSSSEANSGGTRRQMFTAAGTLDGQPTGGKSIANKFDTVPRVRPVRAF